MRTQPRFFPVVTRVTLGVAALVAVLFVAGCASKSASTPGVPNLSGTVASLGGMAPNQVGAQYTITLSNAAGAGATSGTVTLIDPPSNFTITGIAIQTGSGWTCPAVPTSNGFTCTNSNVLQGGQSYSPITVTGNVANALGSNVTIPLQITGGGLTTAVSPTDNFLIAVAPQITSFAPATTVITLGTPTTLTAVFNNGTGSVSNGEGTVTSGTAVSVSPTATTTYTLTVTNAAGTAVTQTATVTVVPAPSIASFVPAATTITAGTSTTLTGVFSNGMGSVNNGVGTVTAGTPVTVTPSATTTYTLTVTNAAGTSVTQNTTVIVVPPPTITSFNPGATSITSGTSTTLTGVFSDGTGSVNNGVGTVTNGTAVTVSPTVTTTYTLTVTNAAGTSVTKTATVTVVLAPSITSFAPAAGTITIGSSTTLAAVFSNGSGSVNNGVGTVTSGTGVSVSPTTTTTYTLTVTNAVGTAVTQQATVTVVVAPVISSFVPGATSITAGNPTTLTALFSNGTGSVNNGVGTVTSGTAVSVSPTATTTYTLTVTNAAGTAVTQTATVTVVAAPAITSFAPAATTITAGNSTTLTAVFSNGTGSVNNAVGTVTSNAAVTILPATTTTYTLTVTNSLGAFVTQNATVTVVAAPAITSFVPGATSITAGNPTTLTGVFSNGTGSVNNAVGTVASGTPVSVSPTVTTTYTLTVTNAAGTAVTQTATITVVPAPAITSFAPTATTITLGNSTMLTAIFGGGTGSVNNGVGTVSSGTAVSVSPTTTTIYTLTVTNSLGALVTQQATVTVVPAPTISSFAPALTSIPGGTSTTLTAVFSNGTGSVNNSVGTVASGTAVTISPTVTTTYTLTVTNAAGTAVTQMTTVTVTGPTITSFIPAAAIISAGSSTTLTAVFGGGTGSINNSVGTVTSGTPVTVSPTATTTYTLTVTPIAGSSVTQMTTVTVVPAPAITSFSPGATTITSGTSTTLTAVFSNGTGSVNNAVGTVTSNTAVNVSPTATTTYTLTVTNAAGTFVTAQTTVTVVAAPTITSFAPGATSITAGTSTTLTAVFSNGTGSVNNAVGTVTSNTAVNVSPTSTTTYTLTVTNAAGTAVTQQTTVTVVAAPTITSFAPGATSITAGTSTTLTAVFSNGTGSVNNAVGTVTSNTAVNVSPTSTTTYTLTVTNSLGASVTQQATVTVVAAPTITSFAPAAGTITAGNATTLTGVFSNGTGSVNNAVGTVTSGTAVSVSPTTTTTYTLTVTNAAGTAVTQQATVTVVAAPTITSFAPAAGIITAGNTTTLTGVFSNGTGSVNNGVGTVTSNTAVSVSPTTTTTYTLTVTNVAGTAVTQQATVTVVPAPTLTSFTPGSTSIISGTSTTLTAVFSNGTGSVNNGVGTVTSGTAVTISPTATTTYTLTVTNAAATAITAQTTVTVTAPACTTNCSLSGNVSGPWLADFIITLTPSGGGTPINSSPTGAGGAYNISGLTFGTTYNVSGSLLGYTYGPASISVNGNLTGETITATPKVPSDTVTGTVSWAGTQSGTLTTYLNVYDANCGNCGPIGGTTLHGTPAAGGTSYTITGLSNNTGNSSEPYFVRAQIDTQGTGVPNASDPASNSSTFTLSSSTSAPSVTVAPQTPPAPQTPSLQGVSPSSGTVLISYNAPTDSNGDEIATQYKIYYTTDSNFVSNVASVTIPAGNHNGIYVLSGLTNTSYYFEMSALNGTVESAKTSEVGPILIGNTSGGAGTFSVAGTVTFSTTPNVNAPLYVGVFSQTLGVYFQRIAPASGTSLTSPVAYSFAGVPSGDYQIFAVVDQNANGYIDAGDITNFVGKNGPPAIGVTANIPSEPAIVLTAANATTFVTTSHALSSTSVSTYDINVGANLGAKLPVSMTLFSGPNVAVPFSVSFANDNNQYSTLFDNADGAVPAVSDTYQFLVTFADGSTQILSSQVNNVLTSLPTPEPMITSGAGITSTNPELNWLAPAAQSPVIATPYTYSVDLNGPNGDGTNENWNYPQNGNGIPSTQTSIVFNSDSKASPDSSLVPGQTYNWDVQVQDANGNTGQSDSTYAVPGGVGPAAKLVFTQQPGNATAGGTIPTVKVTIEDASGNIVTSATNSVAIHIQNNAGGGTLTGGSAVSPVNGVATFSGLSINDAGTGYTLSAASNPALTVAISNPFNVAGAATQLVFTVEPASVGANAPITPAVQVSIEDASNNVVTTATNSVTVAIGTNAGSGTLSGTLSVNAVAGVATFSNLSINNLGNGYTLTASASGFTTITSTTFNVTTPPTTQIASPAAPPLQVGGGARTFTITVTNDVSGDLPTVTGFTLNGVACTTATCGSFGTVSPVSLLSGTGTYNVVYTPPPSLTAAISPTLTVSPSVTGPWFAGTTGFTVYPTGIAVVNGTGLNIVAPGSAAKSLTYIVYNDVNNAGVTLTLTANGYSCASLPTNSCGSLGTPQATVSGTTTTTTVLYTPPSTASGVPAAPYDRPAIQATSVADPTKLFHQNFLISSTPLASPLSIAYGQKFDSALTGGGGVTVSAGFTDTTATKSASWKIIAGTISCTVTPNSAPCVTPSGTLAVPTVTTNGNAVTSTLSYTPPASVPTVSGENSPTITATMTANSAATDSFTFDIVNGACASGSTNNSVLNGSYAFLLKGSGATAGYDVTVGSFTADGNGNITGGAQDINRTIGSLSTTTLTGSYSVGSDNRGCLALTNATGGTSTYRIALGAVSAGSATQGTITLFNDTTGQGPRLTGTLKQQNLTNVTSSSFSGTYAIGLDGMDSSGHRIAIAGLITSNGAGTITNITEDVNDNGSVTNIPLGTISGTYGLATNATNGRGTFAATQSSVTANSVLYVISPSDAFAMTTDATDSNHPIVSGEAKLQTGSFSTSGLTTGSGYVFNAAGIDASNGGSTTALGQAQFTANNGTAATATVTIDENDNGVSPAEAQGTATFAVSSSGRMTGSDAVLGSGFIIYQVDATQGFLVGLDPFASSGYVQKQTLSSFSTSTITGPFFFGGVAPTNGGSLDTGTVTFTPANPAGVVDGADDSSSPNFGGGGGLEPNDSISATYNFTTAPTAPGQGTVGNQSLGYIISPSKFVFMNTGTSQSPNTPELFTAQQSSFTLPSGPAVASVLLSPNQVTGGTSVVGTVVLSAPAPIDGALVTLGSNSASAVVPPGVAVTGGLTTATFTLTTTSVYAVTPVTLSASTSGTPATTTLQVNPPGIIYLAALTVNPGGVVGGTSSTGTAILSAAAPTGGITVSLQSNNTGVAQPAAGTGGNITFAAGASSATFPITTFSTATAATATITGSINNGSGVAPQTATLTVNPASSLFLSSVTASVPAEVGGGSFAVTGTVTLSTTSASNTVVALSSTNALVTVPSSVTVLAGSTTATFPLTTSAVTATTTYYVVGTYSGASVSSVRLQLNPPLTITSTTPMLPLGAVGVAYPTTTLARSGGAGTFTWSLNGTVLPTGLSLNPGNGAISVASGFTGPTTPGTTPFTVQVSDTEGDVAQATLSIRVDNPAVTNPCGSLLGNESMLSGQYAFLLQGFSGNGATSPMAMAGSFFANGTGGITGGEEDFNASAGVQHLSITSVTSGAYTLGSDGRGCVQLKYTGGTTTSAVFHFAMGQKNGSNIDTAGRIIEFDDYTGTGARAAGVIRLQNTSEFALAQLGPRYTFGSDGVDSSGGHFGIAGSFSVSSGVISNLAFDNNDAGTLQTLTGGGGSIGAPTANGRMLVNFTSGGSTIATNAVYIVNKNEFFVVGTAPLSSSPIYSGRVIATASSYTGASLAPGNYVFDLTGTDTGSGGNTACTSASPCSVVNIGLSTASFNAGQTGSFTGTVYETESGAIQADSLAGTTYTVDASSGRLALSGGNQPPVFYLAAPITSGADTTEPISAFIVGSGATPSTGDPMAIFGFAEPQPSATYSNSSLPTPFITATGDRGQTSANTFVGSGTAAGGVQTILRDFSASAGLEVNQPVTNTFTVNADGTVTAVGGGVVEGITNGTKFLFFTGSPAFVKIFEQQ